ncbi:hypothetical protein BDQ17DRAFT_983743 [Cyathus striatus]|nr:hypothetical protein BDQ17DRAFT_983743 [Cyathus striatus]
MVSITSPDNTFQLLSSASSLEEQIPFENLGTCFCNYHTSRTSATMPDTQGITAKNLSSKDALPIYIFGAPKVQRRYGNKLLHPQAGRSSPLESPAHRYSASRPTKPIPKEKFPLLKAIDLPPIHLQPGSFHVPYEVYERMTLPGPQGVEGVYIPWGSSIVLANPWRRIVLTRDTLDMIDGVDSPLFTFYANAPDGIYVPDSACIEQEKVPVEDMVKIKKVKVDIPHDIAVHNAMENEKDVTLTVQPMHEVTVVIRGTVKTVTVTPQNFLFEGTPEQERQQTLARVPKGELSSDLDVEDMRAAKRRRLSAGGSDGMDDL